MIFIQEQAGGTLRIYDTGYGYWGFCQYPDGRPALSGDKGVCLSLNCADEADVDRFYEKVTALGARVLAAPAMQERFPVYSFFIEDPSGYKVEFQKILLPGQELTGPSVSHRKPSRMGRFFICTGNRKAAVRRTDSR